MLFARLTTIGCALALASPFGLAQTKVYHVTNGFGTDDVIRSDVTGANQESVVRGLTFPQDVAVDLAGGKVYWTDFNFVQRANLDGSGFETIVTTSQSTRGVAVDPAGGKVYWTEFSILGGTIQRANLDGSNVEELVSAGLAVPTNIALDPDGGKMYWTDQNDQQVQRANLDGTDVEDLHSGAGWGITVDTIHGHLYWAFGGQLRRSELDGSNPVTVFITPGSITGMDVDPLDGWIYFAQTNASLLARVRLDGSEFEILIPQLDTPLGVDVDRVTCPAPVTYCTAGVSAAGCSATLGAAGAPSASAPSGFTVTASNVEGGRNGLLFFGVNGRQAAPWGNGTSFRCVVPPVVRGDLLPGSGTPGQCDGALGQDLNALWAAKPAKNPGAGAVAQSQVWYRDPQSTSNRPTSFSDALEFTVCP